MAESGIHNEADVRRLARYDVQAMLVGKSSVLSPDIPNQIRMLLYGANQTTQVKICGLSDAQHINAAIEAGADMLGFIFHEPSHRYIRPAQISALLEASSSYVQPTQGQPRPDLVGVFVNKEVNYINDVIEQTGLNYVQLPRHGYSPDSVNRSHGL